MHHRTVCLALIHVSTRVNTLRGVACISWGLYCEAYADQVYNPPPGSPWWSQAHLWWVKEEEEEEDRQKGGRSLSP